MGGGFRVGGQGVLLGVRPPAVAGGAAIPRAGERVDMELRTFKRRRARVATLGFVPGALLIAAASFAGASGATGAQNSVAAIAAGAPNGYPQTEADQAWAYQRFLVSGQADMDRLNQMG